MKFFKKDELKLLWPFYFEALVVGVLYILPAFYILHLLEIGFSLMQIGFLMSSLSLAVVLFEIPTGAIADIFGRKLSVILGTFASGLTIFSIIFFHDFYAILLLFFMWGATGTLISGADEAWVIDLLRHKKKKHLIKEFYIKRASFINASVLISGIIGAFLVKKFGLGIIWPTTGISLILSSFVLLFGSEHFVKKKQHIKEQTKNLFSHSKKSIVYSIKHHAISLLLTISLITIIISEFAGSMIWLPFLQNLGFREYLFGYLFSFVAFLAIFIPYSIKYLTKKIGSYKKYLALILFLMSMLLFLVGFINNLFFGLAIFVLFMALYDFYGPVRQEYFQKFVPGKMRATIGSFNSLNKSLIVIIAAPLAGFLADKIGPQNTLFLSSFILIPAIILYFRIKEKY